MKSLLRNATHFLKEKASKEGMSRETVPMKTIEDVTEQLKRLLHSRGIPIESIAIVHAPEKSLKQYFEVGVNRDLPQEKKSLIPKMIADIEVRVKVVPRAKFLGHSL